jgi:hypothetical protein
MLNPHDIITTSIPLLPFSTIFIKARTVQLIGKYLLNTSFKAYLGTLYQTRYIEGRRTQERKE